MATQQIPYRGYRLDVVTQGPGYKILIYPPGSVLALNAIPDCRRRDDLPAAIAEAKAIVDRDLGVVEA